MTVATPPDPALTYDEREASSILAFAADEIYPDEIAAGNAIDTLLATLQTLGARSTSKGVRIELSRSEGLVIHATRSRTRAVVGILNDEHGRVVLVQYENSQTRGPRDVSDLRFNPLTEMMEGTEDDAFSVPVPGAPRPKRAAAAVVLEQAIAYLREILDREISGTR